MKRFDLLRSFSVLAVSSILGHCFIIKCSCSTLKSNRANIDNLESNNELLFAHVIFRHGERNIDRIYPNDPHKNEELWPEGFGQLTNEGKLQQFKLGQFFRRRYGKLLGNKYSANKVYVQSTDVDRTIMSAQVNLASLFYPTQEERWSDEILWQPIPVHTVPIELDRVLVSSEFAMQCPKYKAAFNKYIEGDEEVQRIYTEYAHIFQKLSRQCGSNITTINDVYWLYDTLQIEKDRNKSLDPWAEEALEPNGIVEYIAKMNFKIYSDTADTARIVSGFLLKEILEHFSKKVNSTLKPDRSLWLYSAHDITISNMLNSLGLFKLHIPPLASSLHFEMYKDCKNQHYVQLFYRESSEEFFSPLNIPKCGRKCYLNQLFDIYQYIIPDDIELECYYSN